ncbi:MAG: hypothetical protein U0326_06985 [Polyangiales bacterium]
MNLRTNARTLLLLGTVASLALVVAAAAQTPAPPRARRSRSRQRRRPKPALRLGHAPDPARSDPSAFDANGDGALQVE